MQIGVVTFRSPSGAFLDDEPIFESDESVCEFNPLDEFIGYVAERIGKELAV